MRAGISDGRHGRQWSTGGEPADRGSAPAASPAWWWLRALLPSLRHPLSAGRAAVARHQSLRYLQIIPVGLVLWGLDAVATVLDVLATANHYWLDVIIAPGVLVLAYAIALLPALGRLSLGMPGPPPMAPDP